jgi:hypothetical protein
LQDNYIKVDAGAVNKMAGVMLCEHNSNMGFSMRYDAQNDKLLFASQDGNLTYSDAMAVTVAGGVGIGTTVPLVGSKLQVYGKLFVNDTTVGLPGFGELGMNGTRIVVEKGGAGVVPYAIGYETGAQWYSVAEGNDKYHKFYNGAYLSMVVGSNNVGIGVSNPAQMLHIQRSLQDNYIKVDAGAVNKMAGVMLCEHNSNMGFSMRYDAQNDKLLFASQDGNLTYSDAMAVTVAGGVGIGTTVPLVGSKLHVSGKMIITGNSAGPDVGTLGAAGDGSRLIFNTGDGTKVPYAIGVESSGLWYSVDSNSSHRFYTDRNVVLSVTSNVGVGTTNPLQMLHLQKRNTSNYIKIDAGSSNAFAGIMFCQHNSNLGYNIRYNAGPGNLAFATQDGDGISPVFTDRMTLTNDGRLGIGKLPAAGFGLDVNGIINATDIRKNGQDLTAIIGSSTTTIEKITNISEIFNNSNSVSVDNFASIPNYGFWAIDGEINNRPDPQISQYYSIVQGSGNGDVYAATEELVQYAVPYSGVGHSSNKSYMYIRHKVGGVFQDWNKIDAGKADTLKIARTINGIPFDGSRSIYVDFWSNVAGSTTELFYNAGNVRIGSSNAPSQLLHVGRSNIHNYIRVDAGGGSVGVNNFGGLMLCKNSDSSGYSIRYDGSSNDAFYVSKMNTTGAFTSNIMSIQNTGSVGIGTDNAGSYRLGVYGGDTYVNTNSFVNGAVGIGTASVGTYKLMIDGGDTYVNTNSFVNGAVGIGTASVGSYKLRIDGGDAYVNTNSFVNGAVGIGTASVGTYKLRIDGGDTYVNTNSFVNGAVGIGTASVGTYKLRIDGGDAYVNTNIYAGGDIVSSFSDMRLKNITGSIEKPLEKIMHIQAFKYVANDIAKKFDIVNEDKVHVGISAQDVREVLPEVVTLAPFDTSNLQNGKMVSKSGEEYLTVSYERMVPLLIECIKELKNEVDDLRSKIGHT